MRLENSSVEDLKQLEAKLSSEYEQIRAQNLKLDLTRGKPSAEQLDLSIGIEGILQGQYVDENGVDLRNYGGLDGLPQAKALFSDVLECSPEDVIIGGNASLSLMHQALMIAYYFGVRDSSSAWCCQQSPVKFLCPVPGYDRHFSICEQLGIEMIHVPMNDEGPDMDKIEALVQADSMIKGIWCVPRFSNPTGIVYSPKTVQRLAQLPLKAGPDFRVMWDNAYAVHEFASDAEPLSSLWEQAVKFSTRDHVYMFGSTSKVTFAGAGVAFMAVSPMNRKNFLRHLGMATIGPDKINQQRHVKFLQDFRGIRSHMHKHAELLRPRFDCVLRHLEKNFLNSDMGTWTRPKGGYFVSFNTRPGLAKEVVQLASEVGVKLTPAGATFPYGKDPEDQNIRIAPSFPTLKDIDQAMEVFCLCVRLASARQVLSS